LAMLLFIVAGISSADQTATKNSHEEMFTEFDLSGSLIPLIADRQSSIDILETLPKSATPWSGYSWSIKQNGLQFPLNVYDCYDKGKTAADWEKKNRLSPKSYNSAWAASALLEKEPSGNSDALKSLRKGLLAGIYDSGEIKIIAGKTDEYSKKFQCTPKELWSALQNYFVRSKHSVILCFDGEEQDQNIPVFAFRITCTPESPESKKHLCLMTLLGVDANSSRDDHKLNVRKETIQFVCDINDEGMIDDDGQWKKVGNSVIPSYAWIPLSSGDIPIRNEQLDKVKVRNLLNLQDNEIQEFLVAKLPENPEQPIIDTNIPELTASPNSPKPETPKPEITKEIPVQKPVYLSIDEMLYLMSNKHSDFSFNASIKGGDGSVRTTGEKFKVFVESAKPGFLYIVAVNNSNDISMIYPVRGENNFIAGNKTVTALPKDDRFFQFSKNFPAGAVRLKVFLTGVPIHISGADDIKILDRRQLSEQSLQEEGIDTENLFGVMITEDGNEMQPMCWLTRRLRMARQQRRSVRNSVKEFPESGEITPPEIEEDPSDDEENPDDVKLVTPSDEPKQDDVKPVTPSDEPKQDDVKPVTPSDEPKQDDIKPVTPSDESKQDDVKPVTPSDEPKQDDVKPVTPSDEPKQEPAPVKKPVGENPFKPEPSEVTGKEPVTKPGEVKPEMEPLPEIVKIPVTPTIIKKKSILDDNPFIEIIGKKPDKIKETPDISDSQFNKVAINNSAAETEQTTPTVQTRKIHYSDIINRNARELFKGFAQDEVLIIFSDNNSIQ
jgi:hypothetical protein